MGRRKVSGHRRPQPQFHIGVATNQSPCHTQITIRRILETRAMVTSPAMTARLNAPPRNTMLLSGRLMPHGPVQESVMLTAVLQKEQTSTKGAPRVRTAVPGNQSIPKSP